jgi:hypothetical protein
LPGALEVTLSVYDVPGREVSALVNHNREAEVHEVKVDGSNLASGVYFYRLQARHAEGGQAGDYFRSNKPVIVK